MLFYIRVSVISGDNSLGAADLIRPTLLTDKEVFIITFTRKDQVREGSTEKWKHSLTIPCF